MEEQLYNGFIKHGGLIFGLGDTAMGLNCYLSGRNAITVNANINYLKAGKGSFITAESKIIKEGKHICFLNALIYDENHELIATMESTYYFID